MNRLVGLNRKTGFLRNSSFFRCSQKRSFRRKRFDSKIDKRGVVEPKSTNNVGLKCLGLSHDSSRSLRGQKAGLWTKWYVVFVEKGDIEWRPQKDFGIKLNMAMKFWISNIILDGDLENSKIGSQLIFHQVAVTHPVVPRTCYCLRLQQTQVGHCTRLWCPWPGGWTILCELDISK